MMALLRQISLCEEGTSSLLLPYLTTLHCPLFLQPTTYELNSRLLRQS